MFYLVREESVVDEYLDAVLYVDQYTKGLYNYP